MNHKIAWFLGEILIFLMPIFIILDVTGIVLYGFHWVYLLSFFISIFIFFILLHIGRIEKIRNFSLFPKFVIDYVYCFGNEEINKAKRLHFLWFYF